jgi:hypothetical protein
MVNHLPLFTHEKNPARVGSILRCGSVLLESHLRMLPTRAKNLLRNMSYLDLLEGKIDIFKRCFFWLDGKEIQAVACQVA